MVIVDFKRKQTDGSRLAIVAVETNHLKARGDGLRLRLHRARGRVIRIQSGCGDDTAWCPPA